MSITAQRETTATKQKVFRLPESLCLRIEVTAAQRRVSQQELVAGVLDSYLPAARAVSSERPARKT